ncbi:type II secretion system F family protein [Rubritalea marina]|uniref:type II secretion system F family protein n=1 Tax=Rubritalea marina TaxID=361055 RepID=UPI000370F00C|nr:type II secretion system F family protein [Rubritalea marina]
MPNFEYTALNAQGEETSGVISAASDAEASQQLRAQGLYPTAVSQAGKAKAAPKAKAANNKSKAKAAPKKKAAKKGGKIKPKALMIFTRQLATLIDSGLPLMRSLSVLSKQEPNPVLRGTLSSLADSVQSGATFSESLAQHNKIFNKLYVNMVKAGELGGVLEVVLTRLAEYMEKADKLKSKIVAAMVYPFIVMFIAVGILVFLMLVIVPKFKEMFDGQDGSELPMISQIVFGFSDKMIASTLGVPNAAWLFVVAVALFAGVRAWGQTKAGRYKLDGIKLTLPLFGDIQRKSAIARFTRTLGTLVTSGVPILQALSITRETAGNVVVAEAIDKVHDAVKEGESIVTPLQASPVFPPMVISMVDVGEETGQLPDMLLKVADVYDDEVDGSVTALTSIIEPVMIVLLAGIVGSIVFAMFLPLIKMIESVGG